MSWFLFQEDWALLHKVTFDGVAKRIYLSPNVSSFTVKDDIYSSWKEWTQIRDNAKFLPALRTIGGDPVGGGQYAGDIYFLINDWQIIVGHTIKMTGILYHDNPSLDPYIVLPGGGVTATVSNLALAYNSGSGVGTVTEVAQAVWGATNLASYPLTSAADKLIAAGNAGDPWSTTNLSSYPAGSAGNQFAQHTTDLTAIKGYTDTLEAGIASLQATLATVNLNTDTLEVNVNKILEEIGNISASASIAHAPATSFHLTAGSVVAGSVLDTKTYDEGEHHIQDVAGALDLYYEFNIGASAIPSSFTFIGHVEDQHEILKLQAYNWSTSGFETIGQVTGLKTNNTIHCALYSEHQGSGAYEGVVRIRMYSAVVSDIQVHVDQIYIGYAVVAPTTVEIRSEMDTNSAKLAQIKAILDSMDVTKMNDGLTKTEFLALQ